MPPRKPAATKAGRRWDEPTAAPLVLVRGPEEYLRELAVTGVKAKAREHFGPLELVELSALDYRPGELAVATSPSLFAEPKLVVLTDFQANEAADADLIAYAKSPNPEACVIVVHGGGIRGKKAVDAV
ncbi:MAG: DNA polymerase III subunit delta, partial [Promicromonosporaceae bacterium]|nr:DNA polymerase III subunit delta [Promicromonosporaceae bacterium]